MLNSRNSNIAAKVRTFLEKSLPDSHMTEALVSQEDQPLLLMRTQHSIVAFAYATEHIQKSYEALYEGFKRYYAEQEGKWDALDLAFVFCVFPDFPQIDQFCSIVETDVYFCRKFVIPIVDPIEESLAQLPFLPLTPVEGQSLRPASAQTFLQQCGIPAVLSKYIVQQGHSPERIVEDCVSGEFGEPNIHAANTTAVAVQPENLSETIGLETMEIQNFRAYRKLQTFVFGADVTVLYGPNGFGKTSFFDAIDFAATGEIGRIKSAGPSDFAKIARHLDSGSEESMVSLTFRSKGAVMKVKRDTDDWRYALLDGKRTDRKGILTKLTGGNIPATDRVAPFVKLFRASHLFSQEHQELAKDFHNDCELSPEIVSRMLAIEDYANAVNKTTRVLDFVKKAIDSESREISLLTEQIAADTKELDRLGQPTKVHANIESLDKEVDKLREKLETVGIVVSTAKPDTYLVRGWRAMLESRQSDSRATSERFSIMAKEVARLPQFRAEIATSQEKLAQKELSLKTGLEKRIATENILQRAEQRLSEMTSKRLEMQARADLLEWVRNTQPRYARLIEHQRELSAKLQSLTESLAQLNQSEDKAAGLLRSLEDAAAQSSEKLKTRRTELEMVQSFRERIPAWQENCVQLAAVLQSEKSQIKTLELLRVVELELVPQLAAVNAKEAHLARQIAEVDKNQSELRLIVSQLQGHVHSGTCPLCGEDHGSKDQLLQRIQKHVAADSASEARADLTGVQEQAKQLRERVEANKQAQEAAGHQKSILKSRRLNLKNEIAHFASIASELGIEVADTEPALIDLTQDLATRLQHEIADLDRIQQEAGIRAKDAGLALENAKNVAAAKKSEADERKAALSRAEEESTRLRSDSRLTDISLDIEPNRLIELENLNHKHVEGFNFEASKAENEVNQKKTEMGMLHQEVTSLKAQLSVLRTKLATLQSIVTRITSELLDSGLSADTTEESMFALISEHSRFQAQLLALQDATTSLELAMDAATTAAALTTLQKTVRNREKMVSQALAKRYKHRPWRKYFEEVSRLVTSQQNVVIDNFTREYGPRTSVIQRRLRTVYGFDDIEIISRESTITVRVKRHGKELRPTDYFSQSQQQTLLLGLFLTACGSQTWSAFSPVFLDDPVTHFDDLNTYAFLDLLVGLLNSKVEKRQFIISTCDEKLLQLAHQKFRHLGDRAKFYRFTSIGADGPVIE